MIRTRPPRDHKCTGLILSATPELVADYLEAKAGKGPNRLCSPVTRPIAKVHQLLDLKNLTQIQLIKLRLRTIRREKGTAQVQARPLRFKGPVRDVEREVPRGSTCAGCLRPVATIFPVGETERSRCSTSTWEASL